MKYICPICGYVYDEEKEGRPFAELPEDWVCPVCTAPKSLFEPAAPAPGGLGVPGVHRAQVPV